jgi:hypothetical protein
MYFYICDGFVEHAIALLGFVVPINGSRHITRTQHNQQQLIDRELWWIIDPMVSIHCSAQKAAVKTHNTHSDVSRMLLLLYLMLVALPSTAAALFGRSSSNSAKALSSPTSSATISAVSLVGDRLVDDDDNQSPTSPQGRKRGKVLADDFDELDLLEAYRDIQKEYRQKAFHASPDDWRVLSTLRPNNKNSDEIIHVSLMEHPSDPLCPYVKMEAILPVSVQDCWNFLLLDRWDETMPKMDPFYEGVDIYGEYFVQGDGSKRIPGAAVRDAMQSKPPPRHSRIPLPFGGFVSSAAAAETPTTASAAADGDASGVHMILARKRTKRIITFGKREFVFLSIKDEPLEDGTWCSGTVSVDAPTKIPRNKSYTRAFQDSIAFYKPLFENNKNTRTKLTIVCRIDLNDSSEEGNGGWIPMWLYVKTIGTTGARSVMSMRNALLGDQQSRREDETVPVLEDVSVQ